MEVFTMDRGGIAVLIKNVAVPASADYYSDEVAVVASRDTFRLPNNFTWEVTFGGTGSYSVCVILLEGSIDGVDWYQLDSNFGALVATMQHVVNKPVRYLRAHVTSTVTISSGTPKISVQITM